MGTQRVVIAESDLNNVQSVVGFDTLDEAQRPASDATLLRLELELDNPPVGGLQVDFHLEYDRGVGVWTEIAKVENVNLSPSPIHVFNNLGAPFALSQLGDSPPSFAKLRYRAVTNNATGYNFNFILYFGD